MARSFYVDRLNQARDLEFEVATEKIHIDFHKYGIEVYFMKGIPLKVRLCARHFNSIKDFVYVLPSKTKIGINAIIGHTCNCKIGQRVSKARFLDTISIPVQYLSGYFDTQSKS